MKHVGREIMYDECLTSLVLTKKSIIVQSSLVTPKDMNQFNPFYIYNESSNPN